MRSAEDLERITALVKSAIGFDEKRGDQVNVVSMRFVSDEAPAAESGGLLGHANWKSRTSCVWRKPRVFGVIGLLALAAGAAADGGAADRAGAGGPCVGRRHRAATPLAAGAALMPAAFPPSSRAHRHGRAAPVLGQLGERAFARSNSKTRR